MPTSHRLSPEDVAAVETLIEIRGEPTRRAGDNGPHRLYTGGGRRVQQAGR